MAPVTLAQFHADSITGMGGGSIGGVGGWANQQTGLGMPGEQTQAEFLPIQPLHFQALANLFYGDPLAAAVVEKHPVAALAKAPKAINPNLNAEQIKRVNDALRRMEWVEKCEQAATFARLFGNAGVWVASTGEQSEARRTREIVQFLKVVDRRRMYVTDYYTDPRRENAGEPAGYAFVPMGHVVETSEHHFGTHVHATRIGMFRGIKTDAVQRAYNAGWDFSVLQRCINVVRDMGETWRGLSQLMKELSIKVLKVKNLAGQLLARPAQTEMRLLMARRSLSILKMLAIDPDTEEFGRVDATALTGAAALLELLLLQVSAASDVPVTELYGRSPTGLNASGAEESEAWRGKVAGYQNKQLRAPMVTIAAAVGESVIPGVGLDGWDIEFPPLVEESRSQRTAARKAVADIDALYITNNVFSPEAIAVLRGGANGSWEADYSSVDVSTAAALARMPPAPSELPDGSEGLGNDPAPHPPPPPSLRPSRGL